MRLGTDQADFAGYAFQSEVVTLDAIRDADQEWQMRRIQVRRLLMNPR